MAKTVLICGKLFDGASDPLRGRMESVLALGKQADIVAMPGDPLADIAATAKVDFVMRAGRAYRYGAFDLLQRSSGVAPHCRAFVKTNSRSPSGIVLADGYPPSTTAGSVAAA